MLDFLLQRIFKRVATSCIDEMSEFLTEFFGTASRRFHCAVQIRNCATHYRAEHRIEP